MDRCEPSCITVTRSLGLVERIDQIDGGGKTRRLCAEWHIQIGVPRQELCRNWRAIFRGRRVRNFADGTGIVGGTALVASVQCRKRWSLPEPVKWAWLRPRHLPCVLACGVAPCAGYKKERLGLAHLSVLQPSIAAAALWEHHAHAVITAVPAFSATRSPAFRPGAYCSGWHPSRRIPQPRH
jgi:hypothetical protein